MIMRFRLASELNADDTAYSPASAPLWTRTTVADEHKFLAVRRLSRDTSGPVVKRNFYPYVPVSRAPVGGDSIEIS